MSDFDASPYDQDTQDSEGFPPGAEALHLSLLAKMLS